MAQATDLGAIANQPGAFYRARVNANIQAAVTNHYGATEPQVMYANMIWFSAGDGYVKLRNPTNTGWQNIGTIGPPLKWTTSVDLPQENFVVGDIKGSYNPGQPAGWQHLNDGSVGGPLSGASSRANPDTWPLFNLLWYVASDDWCSVYSAGTWNRTGKGTNSLADWNANRHILLPRMLGRVPSSSGWGAGLSNLGLATWQGAEHVVLDVNNLAAHQHISAAHSHWRPNHGHPYGVDPGEQSSWSSQGSGFLPTSGSGVVTGAFDGWPAGTDGTVIGGAGGGYSQAEGALPTSLTGASTGHLNIQPTTYVYYFIKL